ncbi:DUF1330 domain-containing protein [Fulvivirgaceae bacterium BMA10]|uniref:DUF1330 domain-containing protein n=1 Tax=Splendidivirga corallicola TaxID=3051826 RepID=A0ABT8KKV3_9BACT|nr:DUF1330 domain-containing protein [Fulvivirgaceae bacterium BMA10]
MKATIIVEGTFTEDYQIFFNEYSERVRNFLLKNDAEIIRRQLIEKTLIGEYKPSLVMIIDFPSKKIAETIFQEQEYLDIVPLREKVFKDFRMFLVEYTLPN